MFYISVESRDITSYCRDVVSILRHNASSKQRVTGLKLLDAWQGRGARAHRAEAVTASTLARADMERVLVYMLLEGYIKEDFHFTAYTTISYLVPGTRAEFDVRFLNDVRPPAATAQIFRATIIVRGNRVARLDSRNVYIVVPPDGAIIII